MMIDIAHKCEFNIINCHFHQSKLRGVSGAVILTESHFTMHT
ncbi:S-adenosylmethionine decarboxylase [Xenorhabdus budapestensis]